MSDGDYPKRGEIYLVDFSKDAKGSEQKGYRPALVIQNDVGNKYGSTVIVAALTTQLTYHHIPTNVILTKKESGLSKDSLINLSQIRTITKKRLTKKIGALDSELIKRVNKAITISLGLIDLPLR